MIEEIKKDILTIYNECKNKEYPTNLDKHNDLQNKICLLAEKYGFKGRKEKRINVESWGDRTGKIDIIWSNENEIKFAIEIDSCFRSKSVQKLNEINCDTKIWLCYSKNKNKFIRAKKFDIYNGIIYITPNIDN